MAKRVISLELQSKKFANNIDKLVKETGRNSQEVLKDGVAEFADFAAKNTMPDKGKKAITKKKYKRDLIELTNSKKKRYMVKIKRTGKAAIFRSGTKSEVKKYQSIDYRGIGRAGWFLNLAPAIGRLISPAESMLLAKSPKIKAKTNINAVSVRKDNISVENRVPEIENYARIAMAQGLRAAANKINRERLKFIKEREAIGL